MFLTDSWGRRTATREADIWRLFPVFNWPGMGWIVSKCLVSVCLISQHEIPSHKLNLCPRVQQTALQAAATVRCGVPCRRNLSCKPIWLSTHDLSLQVWVHCTICGFKSPALQNNWDWLSCVSAENNTRLKAGWMKRQMVLRCRSCCWCVMMSSHSF